MKSWTNLPQEILLQIFSPRESEECILQSKDLSECAIVCNAWTDSARQVHFSKLVLTANMIKQLNKKQQPSFGNYVKTIELELQNYHLEACISTLTSIFPGVEKLCYARSNEAFYSALSSSKAKWEHLKYFTEPSYNEDVEIYAASALKYKNTLEGLFLGDSTAPTYDPDEEIGEQHYLCLLSKIDEFSMLKDLTIKRHSNDGIEAFDSVIKRCPFLKALDIGIYPSLDESIPSLIANIDLSAIVTRPHVKSLDVCLVIHNDKSLLYIMHTFTGLQHFAINHDNRKDLMQDANLLSLLWYTESNITAETLVKFIAYKMSIPLGEIALNMKPNIMNEALVRYSERNNNQLWKLTLTYDTFVLEESEKSLLKIYKSEDHELAIDYNVCEEMDSLPHLDTLQDFGLFIRELIYIQLFTLEEIQENIYAICAGHFVDQILQHCPNLIYLKLRSTTLIQLDSTQQSTNNSIKDLKLSSCTVHKDILFGLSARLPSLKNISLLSCNLENQYDGWGSSGAIQIDMPQTSFANICIEHQYSDRNCRSDSGMAIISNVFVKVTMSAGTQQEEDKFYQLCLMEQKRKYEALDSTKEAYDSANGSLNIDQLKLHIVCKSVETFKLILRNLAYEREGSISVRS